MQIPRAVLIVYLAGVLVALWRTDAAPLRRAGLALVWPLALLACAATLTVLSGAALLLFPLVGITACAVAAGAWWYLR